MYFEEYLTFVMITFLFVLSPGPAVIHAVNNGIRYGNKASSWGVLGNVVALMLLVAVSSVGLGAVLAASDVFFNIFKIIGAGYLCYLGAKIWLSSSPRKDKTDMQKKTKSSFTMFREAFFVTATNPKALAYVTALLPQFLHTNENFMPQVFLLGATIASIQFLVLISYVWFSNKTRYWLEKEEVSNIFNKVTGLVFVGFGILLAFSNNRNR